MVLFYGVQLVKPFKWELSLDSWVRAGHETGSYKRRDFWASVLVMVVLFATLGALGFLFDSLVTGIKINLGF